MSNQSTKNSGMNDDGMLNAETQRKLPQGKISQPKLRFKGFTDPWQQRKLGDLGSSVSWEKSSMNMSTLRSMKSICRLPRRPAPAFIYNQIILTEVIRGLIRV